MTDIDLDKMSQAEADRLIAELARDNFELFWKFCFHQPLADHHQDWHQRFNLPGLVTDGHEKVLVCAPRGWAKSTWALRRILFEIGRNPDILITIVTAEDRLGTALLHEIARNITHNERLQMVFPDMKPSEPWSKTQITVQRDIIRKDPTVKAAGLFSTGVGGRSDLILFDDCTSHRTAVQQPQLRESSKQIFYEVWMNYLLPGGRVMYLCTPWHALDLSMELKSSGEFDVWWEPALDDNGESTWPEIWSTDALMRKKSLNERSFRQQYMLEPISADDIVFHYDTILMGADDDVAVSPDWDHYVGVDLAPALGKGHSYSAIFTLAVNPRDHRNVRHVVDIIRVRATAPEVMDMIVDVARQYDPRCIMVENNGYQQAMVDFMTAKNVELPVVGYRTGTQKLDLQQGVPAMSPLLAAGRFRYPITLEHIASGCECTMCQWIDELKLFPSGQTSDMVMAMWLAERAYAVSRDMFGEALGGLIYTNQDFELEQDAPIEDNVPYPEDADAVYVDW